MIPPKPHDGGLLRHLRLAHARPARLALMLTPLLLGGCSYGIMAPKGPVGAADKTILIDSLGIMLAIVIPVIIATLGFAWWFRAGNQKARYLPKWSYSGRIEMVVWSIPLMVIILLGGVTWIGSHQLDPAVPLSDKKPIEVQVVSLDWRWLFIYPDQRIAAINRLTIPAGRPVHFTLTSASVMTAFFVPELGSMIYTMNGMETQLNLQADAPGHFPGLAAHFSGDGFADMHFDVSALPETEFDSWVRAVKEQNHTLDGDLYRELSKQTIDTKVYEFSDVDPSLFHQIVSLALPPGPGPDDGQPNPGVSPRQEN